jgi:hypothetical protein
MEPSDVPRRDTPVWVIATVWVVAAVLVSAVIAGMFLY